MVKKTMRLARSTVENWPNLIYHWLDIYQDFSRMELLGGRSNFGYMQTTCKPKLLLPPSSF
jgi:hypothetical protein